MAVAKKKVTKGNTIKKKAIISAMEKTMGNVTNSCNIVGITTKTFYQWMKRDLIFKEEIDGIENKVFDFVDSKIMKQIDDENTTMIIFYAKHKMKSRGYVERKEVDFGGRPDINISLDTPERVKKLNKFLNNE